MKTIMQKKLILSSIIFILVTYPHFVFSCSNKIDSSRVMLFIDTNYSDMEIATAQKTSCARGERLVVIPRNYKEYTSLIRQFEASKNPSAARRLSSFVQNQKDLVEQTEELLADLKKEKAKITNFTVSGHDGGGSYSGHKGEVSRYDIARLMKESPEVNAVRSVQLLGCWTTVPYEIAQWKTIFPDVKLVGGYDGVGPASTRPAGHRFLEKILLKENTLLKSTDKDQLQNSVQKNLRELDQLNASLYINLMCYECETSNTQSYYYASATRGDGFRTADFTCKDDIMNEIESLTIRYSVYLFGRIEPPSDPYTGELKFLYDRARRLEHCIGEQSIPGNLFNLRFYTNVKKNFAKYYEKDLEKASKVIKTIPHPNCEIWIPDEDNLAKKSRSDLLSNIHRMERCFQTEYLTLQQLNAVDWLKEVTSHHLMLFQNPFRWHAFTGSTPPPAHPIHYQP